MADELTNAERHLMKKIKEYKKKLKAVERERDLLKGVVMACGVSESTINQVLKTPTDEFTERDRHR